MNPDNYREKWIGSISEHCARGDNIEKETIFLLRIDCWQIGMRKRGLRN
jgi:hypothetical protein